MSSRSDVPVPVSPTLFKSAKTITPIPLYGPFAHDLMIQASLDPAVYAIDLVQSVTVHGVIVQIDAVVFETGGGRHLVDFPSERAPRTLDDEALALMALQQIGLPTIEVTGEQLRASPRAENCRLVWACRSCRVAAGDRVRLLEVLGDEGPLPLARAASLVRFARDGVAAVLALACADLVEIDLSELPIGPETPVRRRNQRVPP